MSVFCKVRTWRSLGEQVPGGGGGPCAWRDGTEVGGAGGAELLVSLQLDPGPP